MHLGFLTPEYPHVRTTPAAGLGTSFKNLATALTEKNIKISIFVYSQNVDDIFYEDGIKFHLIKQRSFKLFGWYLHRKFIQNYLNKYVAIDKINAIEAPDWTGITAFMKLRCPLIIRFHGSDSYFCHLEGRPQKRKNFWFEKTALEAADHLLSVSAFTAEQTRKIFKLKKKVRVIPNSVDAEKFRPKPEKAIPGNILYFGSIIRKKGVLELAEIFNRIVAEKPEARLIMVGKEVLDHREHVSTRQLMENRFSLAASKNVEWPGVLPYDQVLDQIAAANVVVLPSLAEALPMTWLEAMAMEKPLVTANIGWAKEIMVDGETGFTVDPKNHNTYAEKVLKLLTDSALAQQMGKAARKRVLEKFSTDVVVKENLRFYESVVDRR